MGKFKMDITKDKYNTIDPYDRMFERCPSMPPNYERDTSRETGCWLILYYESFTNLNKN